MGRGSHGRYRRKGLTRVLVTGFPWETPEEKLVKTFEDLGTVFEVRIVFKKNGKRKSAFICYEDIDGEIRKKLFGSEDNNEAELDFYVTKCHMIKLQLKDAGQFDEDKTTRSRRIFIRDLPTSNVQKICESDVTNLFSSYGKICESETRFVQITNKKKKKTVFYASLIFEDPKAIQTILKEQEIEPFELFSFKILIEWAGERRKVDEDYPESRMIFAQLVPLKVSEADLKEIFSQFGPVISVQRGSKKINGNGQNKGNNQDFKRGSSGSGLPGEKRSFAFITFSSSESVKNAIDSQLQGVELPSGQMVPFRRCFPKDLCVVMRSRNLPSGSSLCKRSPRESEETTDFSSEVVKTSIIYRSRLRFR